MTKSKRVKDGDIVTLRGDKLVRTGKRMRVFGVYTDAKGSLITRMDGTRVIVKTPAGVIVHGATLTTYVPVDKQRLGTVRG